MALGADAAESLHKRLADIEAAENLSELFWMPTTAVSGSSMALEFHEGHRLVVIANNGEKTLNSDGKIDWTNVDRIKLVGLQKP